MMSEDMAHTQGLGGEMEDMGAMTPTMPAMPCDTYSMGSVLDAREVHHAINAGEGGAAAAVSMRVEFLLGEDVTARL